ncbi:hypothetical protein BFJ70_g17421 [Fusarium oxysporum]|nr:hypothetical protein BFJ70_g17421 [Fusarium oxysporum]
MCLISNDTADALFVWSSLNLLYVFGISGRLVHDLGDEWGWGGRKDRVLGVAWIPMVRGVQAVLQQTFSTARSGPLSQLSSLGNWDQIHPDKATDPEDKRFCHTRGAWENSSDAPTYEAALSAFRRCRQFMARFVTTDAEALKDAGFNRTWQGPFLFFPFALEE